jgi:DNA-binding PadR family transcriptional regulator
MLLALLSRQPMHGYELMAELESRLGRRYKASPGSIYPALTSLENEGLIEAKTDGDRKVFELTGEGARAFTRRADRIAAMEARLGIKIASGLDVVLARLGRRVWSSAPFVDEARIEQVLDRAAEEIEGLAQQGGQTR